jgi:hypothetical protein
MIEWINVKDRVPNNRRSVLAWGNILGMLSLNRGGRLLGVVRYNPYDCFDCEKPRRFSPIVSVSHWAEISSPEVCSIQSPPKNP